MSKSLTQIKAAPYKQEIKRLSGNRKFFKAVETVSLQRDPLAFRRASVQLGGMNRRAAEERARLAEMR